MFFFFEKKFILQLIQKQNLNFQSSRFFRQHLSGDVSFFDFLQRVHGIRRVQRASQEGGSCSLVPYENLQFFPCSSKINQGVPRNSFLLSSPVPRNSAPCSLYHQKYSSLFPSIPLIFNFSWLVIFIGLPKNERNCNTLAIFCRRKGLFPSYTLKKVFPMVRKSMLPCSRL